MMKFVLDFKEDSQSLSKRKFVLVCKGRRTTNHLMSIKIAWRQHSITVLLKKGGKNTTFLSQNG